MTADSEGLYTYALPAPPPDPISLEAVRDTTTAPLGTYAEFLQEHDGWYEFFMTSTLFSCKEIIDRKAQFLIDPILEALGSSHWLAESLTIGASLESNDLFSISPRHDGAIIWSAYGETVRQFKTASDFFNGLADELLDEFKYIGRND